MWLKIALIAFIIGAAFVLLTLWALGAVAGRADRDAREVLDRKRKDDLGDLDYIERSR